eukprot:6179015-Pleurochrysis_carterae.AAC.2
MPRSIPRRFSTLASVLFDCCARAGLSPACKILEQKVQMRLVFERCVEVHDARVLCLQQNLLLTVYACDLTLRIREQAAFGWAWRVCNRKAASTDPHRGLATMKKVSYAQFKHRRAEL